jgi:hypothetical protein
MKESFYKDLAKVYEIIKRLHDEISSYYGVIKGKERQKEEFINSFLKELGLKINEQNQMAIVSRLVTLRDDLLSQSLKKAKFDEEQIIEKKELAYLWVAKFHTDIHQRLIDEIFEKELLTPFYREIFRGTHEVGKRFSSWQSSWTAHIINGVNRELYRYFNGDEEKIFEMLNSKDLHDLSSDGQKGDRSYSVIVQDENKEYIHKPYSRAFATEVTEVLKALAEFKNNLLKLEDEVFDQQKVYTEYLQAIIEALAEVDRAKLIPRWAEVDRRWMRVTAPLQIGHPLEYYEDHYRKAVALEWDLRITNPDSNASRVKDDISKMYKDLFFKLKDKVEGSQKIYQNTNDNINRVQLYIGRPALYYGAEFCGLFSAQVVPNDEDVTKEAGKKIFAFADNVLDSARAKPFMKIQSTIFPKEFLDTSRELIFKKEELWHEVYNITTIGHEYGHILWLDEDSERLMNKSGNFKNIEEFKATTGGLMAFFENQKEELKEYVLNDTIKRAVGLIAWRETAEVEPYYCEGLIHLHGLFESGVLEFDKRLKIDMSKDAYKKIKSWYQKTYSDLALHYLNKEDATTFLKRYTKKEGRYWMPIDEKVNYFVKYYWNLHQDIGQLIDDESSREDWV